MISHPKIGQRVQVWYRTTAKAKGFAPPADYMPYHACCGTVRITSNPRRLDGLMAPRNVLVQMDTGQCISVPCGNLRPPPADLADEPTDGNSS